MDGSRHRGVRRAVDRFRRSLTVAAGGDPAIVGFLAFAIALGPGARSSLGARVGRWFRGIGVIGRLVVILTFAVAVAVAGVSGAVPMTPLRDAATGGLAAVIMYHTAHLLAAWEVSGWIADREGS